MSEDNRDLERALIDNAPEIDGLGIPPPRVRATPFEWVDPSEIAPRKFLYGFELQRGQVSAVVAPGAAGKTTFKVGRSICMATGRELLGERVWNGPHKVWSWNLEDSIEELQRSISAFVLHHNIDPEELGGNLFVDSALDGARLKLADTVDRGGFRILTPFADALIEELRNREIDYLDVDPFVSSHSVSENDNGAIDAVAKEWVRIAQEANCAISLAHHVRKPPNGGLAKVTVDDTRGAGSMIAAARSCLVLNKMNQDEADACDVSGHDKRYYFSVMDGKNNRAPPALKGKWFKLVGVDLGNGDESDGTPADNVAAVERFIPPDLWGGLTKVQVKFVQERIDQAPPEKRRSHSQAVNWVGYIIADALDLMPREIEHDKVKVKTFLREWIDSGLLRTVMVPTGHASEVKEGVEVGHWIDDVE